jgi:hypothetical protein
MEKRKKKYMGLLVPTVFADSVVAADHRMELRLRSK